APAKWQRDPSSRCLNAFDGSPFATDENLLGEETINGYRTVKVNRGIITEWHALDYGCALVKDRWEFSANEITEKQLVAITAGEPDPHLFEVSGDYREVPPSETMLGTGKGTAACNDHTRKLLQKLDDNYKRRQLRQQ